MRKMYLLLLEMKITQMRLSFLTLIKRRETYETKLYIMKLKENQPSFHIICGVNLCSNTFKKRNAERKASLMTEEQVCK